MLLNSNKVVTMPALVTTISDSPEKLKGGSTIQQGCN